MITIIYYFSLNKLCIELKVPFIVGSPQELLKKSMEAKTEKMKVQTVIELPAYYNSGAINSTKYAEQIPKRNLLWGDKQQNNIVEQVEECKPTMITVNETATIRQSTDIGDINAKVLVNCNYILVFKILG